MRDRIATILGIAALLALAACEQHPTETAVATRFVAAIEGSVSASYEGTGWFQTTPPVVPRPLAFFLYSRGLGATADQGFEFSSRTRPEVGRYSLGNFTLGEESAILAAYTLRNGNRVKRFSADAGELEITASSATRVEGTFHFTATAHSECEERRSGASFSLTCKRLPPDPDAARVEISGAFEAVASRFGPGGPHR